jgi:hypothetical protein
MWKRELPLYSIFLAARSIEPLLTIVHIAIELLDAATHSLFNSDSQAMLETFSPFAVARVFHNLAVFILWQRLKLIMISISLLAD